MFEARIAVDAPELAAALNNLAAAISGAGIQSASVQKAEPTPTQTQAPAAVPQQNAAPVPTASVPTAQPKQYTVDDIMAAGATLMDAGKVNELIELLHKYGVQAVLELKPEQLGPFATDMRELGAKI